MFLLSTKFLKAFSDLDMIILLICFWRIYLPAEMLETYVGEQCLLGLPLWHELLKDFGLISFKQTLEDAASVFP